MQAYCMKCRAKREMEDAKSITMENGKLAPVSYLTAERGSALCVNHSVLPLFMTVRSR